MIRKMLTPATIVAGGLVTAGLFVLLAHEAIADAWRKARGGDPDDAS